MSPTSTERRPRPNREFRRAFAFTTAGLFVLCLALLGLGYLQGPRLQSGQVDAAAVTTTTGSQLRLFLNQAVAQVDAAQVSVQPQTPVTVTTANDVVAIEFGERLDYGTEYRVSVTGLTSPYLPQTSSVEYRFTTASPQLTWLDRGAGADAIRTSTLDGVGGETLYSGTGIQDFAFVNGALAVVSLASEQSSALDLVSLDDVAVERIRLPAEGAVQQLDASGAVLGFTLTTPESVAAFTPDATLYTLDLGGDRTPKPVPGIDGEPMNVLGWGFVPGTANLVALTYDRTLVLVADGQTLPLGRYQEFGSISVDGTSVVAIDARGAVSITLADGSVEPIVPSPIDGQEPFSGHTQQLPDGSRIGKALLVDATGTRFSTLLVRDDGTQSTILYRTVDDRGSIGDFRISPNGQYVAIEVVPDVAASESDGYPFDFRATSITTVIVDALTGEQVRSMDGFGLLWD